MLQVIWELIACFPALLVTKAHQRNYTMLLLLLLLLQLRLRQDHQIHDEGGRGLAEILHVYYTWAKGIVVLSVPWVSPHSLVYLMYSAQRKKHSYGTKSQCSEYIFKEIKDGIHSFNRANEKQNQRRQIGEKGKHADKTKLTFLRYRWSCCSKPSVGPFSVVSPKRM